MDPIIGQKGSCWSCFWASGPRTICAILSAQGLTNYPAMVWAPGLLLGTQICRLMWCPQQGARMWSKCFQLTRWCWYGLWATEVMLCNTTMPFFEMVWQFWWREVSTWKYVVTQHTPWALSAIHLHCTGEPVTNMVIILFAFDMTHKNSQRMCQKHHGIGVKYIPEFKRSHITG